MKNLSLILNAILFAGLVIIYVLFFSQKSQVSSVDDLVDSLSTEIPEVSGGIAFVQIDSVYIKYQMAIDLSKDLENEVNTSEARLSSKMRSFQNDVASLQEKVQKQMITRADLQVEQQLLMEREQQLMSEQQGLQQQLSEKSQVMNNQVIDAVMKYIESIEDENDLNCVIGTGFGDNVLYFDPALDITQQVINGLNEEYRKANEQD